MFAMRRNCSNRFFGMKVSTVYLDVRTSLVQNLHCSRSQTDCEYFAAFESILLVSMRVQDRNAPRLLLGRRLRVNLHDETVSFKSVGASTR